MYQPDDRIHKNELGFLSLNGKRFVVNTRIGVPRNSVIEDFGGALRCWASRVWLDEEAAAFVRENADFNPGGNNFTWKKDFYLKVGGR